MPPSDPPAKPPRAPKRAFGGVYESRGRWRVRYSIRGVRYDIAGGDTRDEAEGVLARATLDRAKARLDGRRVTAPVTLEALEPRIWAVWGATLRKATLSTRRAVLRHYREALPGPMRDVTLVEVEAALYGRLGIGIRPVSVDAERRVMSSVWELAKRLGAVHENPWRGAKLPKAEIEQHRRCSDEEVDRLADAAGDMRLAVLLMADAGLRRGEVTALTWADVADDKRTVIVRARVAKSHRTRAVPVSARVTQMLEAAGAALPTARVCPWSTARLNVHFRRAADSVGLGDVTPHTLRHSYAHRLAEAGVSLYVLRDLLGHASVQQTEVYAAQATADVLRAAVDHADTLRVSRSRARSDSRT